jgi:preprotein translocase subunit Sec61beta
LSRHKINNGEPAQIEWQTLEGLSVSTKKKKDKKKAPMPAASAGLLRFFEEETEGIKVRPEILVVLSIALIVIAALAHAFFP